jgi:hypothetical protein
VFRPGGHGALIENLNNLNADIVLSKNIDNVIQNNNEKVALYKSISWNSTRVSTAGMVCILLDETTVEQDKIEEITDFLRKS